MLTQSNLSPVHVNYFTSCQSQHRMLFLILQRMSHFKIKTVPASVVLYLSGQIAWNISPYFVHFLLLVKSRLTCIILIITRIKVQASNSKEEISLQLTILFIIFIYFGCLTDKQWKKVLTISCISTFFCKYEHFYSN